MQGWRWPQALAIVVVSAAAGSGLHAAPHAATADPGELALTLRDEDYRVARIAFKLATRGATYCTTAPLSGLLFHHLADYDATGAATMASAYALDRGPGVLAVVAGGPATRAGLRAGDVLVDIPGLSPLASRDLTGLDRRASRKAIDAFEDRFAALLGSAPLRLGVLREGQRVEVNLGSVPGCASRIRLARSAQVNAFATGTAIIVTTGLLDFVANDDELAAVIAHELAHNILSHPTRLREAGVPARGLLRGFGINASRVWRTEAEADQLGIRLAAAAGYDAAAAIGYYRRFYARFDRGTDLFRTHPSQKVRERLILAALAALPSDAGAQRPQLGEGALPQR